MPACRSRSLRDCGAAAARPERAAISSSNGSGSSRPLPRALANPDARIARRRPRARRPRATRRARLHCARRAIHRGAGRHRGAGTNGGRASDPRCRVDPCVRDTCRGRRLGREPHAAAASRRRRRRRDRGREAHPDLRRQQVHPLALLRDRRAEGVHRERRRARGSTRTPWPSTRSPRSRTSARPARSATSARTASPTKPRRPSI